MCFFCPLHLKVACWIFTNSNCSDKPSKISNFCWSQPIHLPRYDDIFMWYFEETENSVLHAIFKSKLSGVLKKERYNLSAHLSIRANKQAFEIKSYFPTLRNLKITESPLNKIPFLCSKEKRWRIRGSWKIWVSTCCCLGNPVGSCCNHSSCAWS